MNQIKLLLIGIIAIGTLLLAAGIYLITRPAVVETQPNIQPISNPLIQQASSQPRMSSPNCVVSYSLGSCWTIPPPETKSQRITEDAQFVKSSVTVEGNVCTIIVPAATNGVKTAGCQVNKGEVFEIFATGTVAFSSDHPRVDASGMNGWYDPGVDSPFTQNVGGLEFSINSLSANRYFAGTYYKGTANESGEFVFRVINRLIGYNPDSLGGYKVRVIKNR